ncbi:MAG: hypothetical protein CMJ64_24530 [Planctomycetaceae bacterium]|nr:hypothetical protein [Planctomycetaceae bacterium]
MANDLSTLSLAAAGIGFLHCVGGPDHYLPFVAMSRVGVWSLRKTLLVTTICGIGHVIGSALLGLLGIAAGVLVYEMQDTLDPFVKFESGRGNMAAWLLVLAGVVYCVWGVSRGHHHHGNEAVDEPSTLERITPWVLFTIFAFGPCEPLIPLLMYPAAKVSLLSVVFVTAVFGATTLLTMTVIVAIMHRGLQNVRLTWLEHYRHAAAGFVLVACGIAMILGL